VNQRPRPGIKASVRRQGISVLCQTIKRRSRSLANISCEPTRDAQTSLNCSREEAEVYFPKFGFGRNSFFEMVKGFEGALEYIQHDYDRLTFIPSADYLIVEGTSHGRMSGKRRLRLLRRNRLSAREPISQIIAQLLVRSWDNGWDNRRGSTRDRIALKRRQRNDLVGFELFLRSQMLYPAELRARSETLHCQQSTASSSSISTSSFSSF
jgi:hypothetical protein